MTTTDTDLPAAIASALSRIPPLWPLRHFVAVNPYVGFTHQPLPEACAVLAATAGSYPLQKPRDYLTAWRQGEITPADLEAVMPAASGPGEAVRELENLARQPESAPLPTAAEGLDDSLAHGHWAGIITEEIAKWCAVHYDENQTTWVSPWRNLGLFPAWLRAARYDANPEAMGLRNFRRFVQGLPDDAGQTIEICVTQLGIAPAQRVDFFTRQLQTIAGWAGYIQYRVREDQMRGRQNPDLRDLLAIRLAYDAALQAALADDNALSRAWSVSAGRQSTRARFELLARWQSAFEHGYQADLARKLAWQQPPTDGDRPAVQAIFCIDVRSEVLRRHLEAAWPEVRTIGFAGFFGFPVAHAELGQSAAGARCPVLLVPPVESTETGSLEQARTRQADAGAWKAFQNSATSCFSFVETLGAGFSAGLASLRGRNKPTCARPALRGVDDNTRVSLLAGALRNMSLTRGFGRVVLVCGHGSRSANNPYASSLDCGACGGHAGDVNARLAAETANDPLVRVRLAAQGIDIPDDTWFVAGLHETTTDQVALLDLDLVPDSHRQEVARLQSALDAAAAAARRERAQRFGQAVATVDRDTTRRTVDVSEVRPEWGLANNAALIVAPRWRTAGLNLAGRTFLHDYVHENDTSLAVLTLILTAPMVVASWINLHYYASRLDPERYGSGNKVLHNVTSGLGVVEGNAGDLRVGLPWQSIHDGRQFRHEPRRLTVFVEAPQESIDTVLGQHPEVLALVENEWLHLLAISGDTVSRRHRHGWSEFTALAHANT